MKKIPDHNTYMDNSLMEIEHYEKHFYMRPYIGEKFCDTKILIVCKTFTAPHIKDCMTQDRNRLHGVDQVNSISDKWHNDKYEGERKSFISLLVDGPNEPLHTAEAWLDTREHLEARDRGNGDWPWHHIAKALLESGALQDPKLKVNDFRDVYKYLALTNYFVRPLVNGVRIKKRDVSPKESYQTLIEVIRKIEPRLVCFIGKYAWDDFCRQKRRDVTDPFPEITFEGISSPLSRNGEWQNENSGRGRERLKELFEEYWLC